MPAFGNGYGDWNKSWKEWNQGSAIHGGGSSSGGDLRYATGRLRLET